MIPKVINYIWFGEDKTDKVKKCIDSWHKILPDWTFSEWNESHFDFGKLPPLIQKYVSEKWAFVADYCRLLALQKQPGIYIDTDMYLIRPFTDEMLNLSFFAGIESDGLINTAILGLDGSPMSRNLLRHMIIYYKTVDSMFMSPYVLTPIIKNKYNCGDLEFNREESYVLSHNAMIYACEYFYPLHWTDGKLLKYRPCLTHNTIGIHEWSGNALDDSLSQPFEDNYRDIINKFLEGEIE